MIVVNKSGIEIPDYLDEKFFKDTLEDGFRETGIVLKQMSFELGSNAGDNYCSSIYRVTLDYQRRYSSEAEVVSVIAKTIPITDGLQFLDDVGVFMKEKSVYCDVIPRLEVLLDNVQLGPKLLYALKEPVQTIVFQDLKVLGFTNASRQDGLDFAHCRLLLERLGQLHSSSMVLAKKDPSILDRFKFGMLSEQVVQKTETISKIFCGYLRQLIELVSTWPGYEEITEKLRKYHDNFKANTVAVGRPKPGEISVLNHGDLWTANCMFAYDERNPKKPIDMLFLDFQLSYYCSPACDINFFLNSSVQYDVLVNQRDELIDIYYQSFAGTLNSLNYPNVPTIQDLKRELRERERYGFFAMFGFLPVVSLPKEHSDGSSIESISSDEQGKQRIERMFANEKLYKHFRYSLKRFDELGVLDEFI